MGQLVQSASLRDMYEAKGGPQFTRLVCEELRANRDDSTKGINPDRFSLLEMAEATKFPWCQDVHNRMLMGKEAIDMTTFPTITEEVIQSFLIPGWGRVKDVASKLIGLEFPCTDDPIRVAGMTDPGGLLQRPPGGEYAETEMAEMYVQLNWQNPFGRIISLKDWDIKKDRTGQLKTRAASIGQAAAETEQKEVFYVLADAGTKLDQHACYAYYPAGTRTAIYSTTITADTTGQTPRYTDVGTNVLADISDVQAADAYLAKQTNNRGDPIQAIATKLIVPRAKGPVARAIRRQMLVEKGKKGASGAILSAFAGGVGVEDEDFEVIASPYLDALSTDDWYWGAPERQFVRAVFYPLETETVTLGPQNTEYLRRDTVFVCRVRWLKRTFALDYRYVILSGA